MAQQYKQEVAQALRELGEHGKFRIVGISLGQSIIYRDGAYYGRYDHHKHTFVD